MISSTKIPGDLDIFDTVCNKTHILTACVNGTVSDGEYHFTDSAGQKTLEALSALAEKTMGEEYTFHIVDITEATQAARRITQVLEVTSASPNNALLFICMTGSAYEATKTTLRIRPKNH